MNVSTKKALLLFEVVKSAHNTCIFWSIFRDALCGKDAFAGVGERADVRGENMQIFLCLHGRTLTKAVPGSPIKDIKGSDPSLTLKLSLSQGSQAGL